MVSQAFNRLFSKLSTFSTVDWLPQSEMLFQAPPPNSKTYFRLYPFQSNFKSTFILQELQPISPMAHIFLTSLIQACFFRQVSNKLNLYSSQEDWTWWSSNDHVSLLLLLIIYCLINYCLACSPGLSWSNSHVSSTKGGKKNTSQIAYRIKSPTHWGWYSLPLFFVHLKIALDGGSVYIYIHGYT